jgi:Ca-activated chloride channel family protein
MWLPNVDGVTMPSTCTFRFGLNAGTTLWLLLVCTFNLHDLKAQQPLKFTGEVSASLDSASGGISQQGSGDTFSTDPERVSLNVTVLDSKHQVVRNLEKEDFKILEDGVPQTLLSSEHADIPVSIALVIDQSGSIFKKRPAVNQFALNFIAASNPGDEAFVVNFANDAYIDQGFTSDPALLRAALSQGKCYGPTALYDAIVASADKLAAESKNSKKIILVVTDGTDNASTLNLAQAIRRVQQLSGPVIYSVGLLFGEGINFAETHFAHRALEMLSAQTGGLAFFPKSLDQIDQIAADVAGDIRTQYTLTYHSTKPSTQLGFRKVTVLAQTKSESKLKVRTLTGYFPIIKNPAKPAAAK